MTTALEQSFADICEKHGLTCLSVNFHSGEIHASARFTAYVHREGSNCGSASSNNLGEAIGRAIAELEAQSLPLADEPLTVETVNG